ncbi:MAG: phosphoribosylformylglycinamidine synthase II, partial [Leifsonia sp.]|nr:phosphoribosylformylglycinamidine synthase II [Leifsonia sp.]
GENLYLLGITRDELDGSVWAGTIHDHLGGLPPRVDLAAERNLGGLLAAAAEEALVTSAHDLSDGGLLATLAEGVLRFGVGARVWITELMERDGVDALAALLAESTARVLVSVAREDDVKFRGLCAGREVPVLRVGVTDGEVDGLEIQDRFTLSRADLAAAHRGTLPERFGPLVGG